MHSRGHTPRRRPGCDGIAGDNRNLVLSGLEELQVIDQS